MCFSSDTNLGNSIPQLKLVLLIDKSFKVSSLESVAKLVGGKTNPDSLIFFIYSLYFSSLKK